MGFIHHHFSRAHTILFKEVRTCIGKCIEFSSLKKNPWQCTTLRFRVQVETSKEFFLLGGFSPLQGFLKENKLFSPNTSSSIDLTPVFIDMKQEQTSLTYFVRYEDYPDTLDFVEVVGTAYWMKTFPIDKFAIPKNLGVMSEIEFGELGVEIVFKPRPKRIDTVSPKGLTMYFDYEDWNKSSDFGKMVIALTKNSPAYLIYFPTSSYDYLEFSYRFTETRLEVKISEKFPL